MIAITLAARIQRAFIKGPVPADIPQPQVGSLPRSPVGVHTDVQPDVTPRISIYEALDYMADRFRSGNFEKLLRITFEQYLEQPAVFEAQADALIAGKGINIVAHNVRIVPKRKHPKERPCNGRTIIEL